MMIDNNDSNRIGCFSVTCFFTFSLLLFFENSASSLAFLSPHDSLSLSLSLSLYLKEKEIYLLMIHMDKSNKSFFCETLKLLNDGR